MIRPFNPFVCLRNSEFIDFGFRTGLRFKSFRIERNGSETINNLTLGNRRFETGIERLRSGRFASSEFFRNRLDNNWQN